MRGDIASSGHASPNIKVIRDSPEAVDSTDGNAPLRFIAGAQYGSPIPTPTPHFAHNDIERRRQGKSITRYTPRCLLPQPFKPRLPRVLADLLQGFISRGHASLD